MSKGSKRRPTTISAEEADKRWEMAFGKKEKPKKIDLSRKSKQANLNSVMVKIIMVYKNRDCPNNLPIY